MKKRVEKKFLISGLIILILGLIIVNSSNVNIKADVSGTATDIIGESSSSDWFHNYKTEEEGTWVTSSSMVSVDAFGGAYSMDGANLITNKAVALGAYEFETKITITELNKVQNPMVGIIPWYIDEDNYLFLQLKFTNNTDYFTKDGESSDGYAIEQIIFSGKYNGESKYITATTQQENTTYDSLTIDALKNNKVAPTSTTGHTIKVRFENNSSTATSYKATIYYNGNEVGSTYVYYYNAVSKITSVGFMAQDVKAEFTSATVTDFYATNNTVALARDWKESNNFIYRVLNGTDAWTFNADDSISFDTGEIKSGTKVVSKYKVSGTNIAGYDTNRGFTSNPYKETDEGLPQNYKVSAKFKLDEVPTYSGTQQTLGYGLLAWYKDDQNFVDVTFRRSVTGIELAPEVTNEIVLFGWIDCSSANIGENTYTLSNDFDFTKEHTLTVLKKSTGFYVYLDDSENPIITKIVKGTNINYSYGYEGYNAKFSASKIESEPIYEAYDEIAVVDSESKEWRTSSKATNSWVFKESSISISAQEATDVLTNRSYLLAESNISDSNMIIEATGTIALGTANYAEFMLSPYILDENNYARIGLIWKDSKVYAYLRVSTYTEEDIDDDKDPSITLVECELDSSLIDLSKAITIKAQKANTTLALYVNEELVYGKEVKDINYASEDYGLYIYNMDLSLTSFETEGYKKYTKVTVGDWTTSGMKYNAWTVDSNGYLEGDATYTSEMEKDDDDAIMNWAIKENTLRTNYEMTVDIIATAQSEAEDRVGVVMWYLDEDNFMIFYMDRWRSDSTVPRTTIYGKLGGDTLPTTYNHGGWLAEGDVIVNTETGMTQTEASQVTSWHTIKIVKEGNTFTCYVDNDTNGYISYTVESGLPSIEGETLYSGIYSFNDAVLVRSYDVTAVNGFSEATLPSENNNPISQVVEVPTFGNYSIKIAKDAFDNIEDNSSTETDPGENPGGDEPGGDEPGGDEPVNPGLSVGAKIAIIVGSSILCIGAALAVILIIKKKKKV